MTMTRLLEALSHRRASVNGVDLHYVIGGSGPPVVLLHGYPETWYGWRKVMPDLAERHTVIVPDMRGLGESSRPVAGYDKKTVAEDIHELLESLGIARAAVVSADMGGPVAFAYAAAHPDAVTHFAFLESGIPAFGLEEAMDVTRGGSWHFGFFMAAEYPEMLTAGREREFLTKFAYRGAAYIKDAIDDEAIIEYVRRYASPGGMSAGFAYYRALEQDRHDNESFAPRRLAMPVLAVDGDHGYRTSAPAMRRVASNVRSVIIRECGHWIAEEQPAQLLEQLIPFLSSGSS